MKNDLISRAALISAFLNRQRSEHEVKYHTIPGEDVLNMIQNAPTVEPTKGEWITHKTGLLLWEECNKCHTQVGTVGMNFCPNCGADMRTEAES